VKEIRKLVNIDEVVTKTWWRIFCLTVYSSGNSIANANTVVSSSDMFSPKVVQVCMISSR